MYYQNEGAEKQNKQLEVHLSESEKESCNSR
jgi:hypothetical protein